MKCLIDEEEHGFRSVQKLLIDENLSLDIAEELKEILKNEEAALHKIEKDSISCITEKCISLGIAEKILYPVCFNWKYLITDKNYVVSRSLSDSEEPVPQIRILKVASRYRLFVPLKAQKELKDKGYKIKPLYKIGDRYLPKAEVEKMDFMEKRYAFAGYYIDIAAKNLIKCAIDKQIPLNMGSKNKTNEHSKKSVSLLTPSGKKINYESVTQCYKKYFAKLCSESSLKKALSQRDFEGNFYIKKKKYQIQLAESYLTH